MVIQYLKIISRFYASVKWTENTYLEFFVVVRKDVYVMVELFFLKCW